jgi:hypothetical protein
MAPAGALKKTEVETLAAIRGGWQGAEVDNLNLILEDAPQPRTRWSGSWSEEG